MPLRLLAVAAALTLGSAATTPTALAAPAATTAKATTKADAGATRTLHALFARQWEDSARRYPEWATWRGDHRYDDRLGEVSPEAEQAALAQERRWLAEARAIPRARLSPADRVSLDLFIEQRERHLAEQPFEGWRSLRIAAMGGVQSEFSSLLRMMPMTGRADAAKVLARMAALPRRIDQEIALMRRGLALGWVPAAPVLDRALAQIDAQLPADPTAGPFFEPWRRLPPTLPAAERAALEAQARGAIERDVVPAMRRLREFVAGEYRAKAPADGSLARYPDGARVYEMLVRQRTTTALGADAIHALGLRELAQLRAEMEDVKRSTGFSGDFAAFVKWLNTDPRFFVSGPDELLQRYRAIAKRFDAEMPRLFAELPRGTYGVRAMPEHLGPDAAEFYEGGAADGSRPGWFNANLVGWRQQTTWGMATLVAHEAVPGHHLQGARALELSDLPDFRREGGGYTAYVEGWALYAETLMRELGAYDDPYSLFGHLQWQAFRAARLVVDTGLHARGWSRQQAIDFMVERTGVDRPFVEAEVDRYTSDPGQALGYMVGRLKLDELRARAQARLGPKFDLRRFHNALIDQGELPLSTLETLVDEWIAREARRR
ncbi:MULTISPECIES: DUF885 family protein [unclassified Rubrivivax]|uniref:DUF885 domain-containing protein n=1 Tax=unclassified Rubrivivax TaxID=2649762 RepID=UPI001E4C045B|nr:MULTISPECIES: DUF885 domain-containing protein [unclassified Rubrivivax]MCC9596885.1 DUF885 domain-containing protein [Rubrivivax sp. JA1055]MCC9649041.1 DUF885 domain-containing protein [Rubrivivax sp. JA1029]